jgi:chromatin segregation and condensation protein Rec8/ScpA/Scc1 (kleisin family)
MSEPEIAPAGTSGGFAVEVPGFAGPFRLLADLVLEQKVDVCDVPIATVTGRFPAYAKEVERGTLRSAVVPRHLRDPLSSSRG